MSKPAHKTPCPYCNGTDVAETNPGNAKGFDLVACGDCDLWSTRERVPDKKPKKSSKGDA